MHRPSVADHRAGEHSSSDRRRGGRGSCLRDVHVGLSGGPREYLACIVVPSIAFTGCGRRFPSSRKRSAPRRPSLSFVDSVWEMFGPMLQGITTVIIPDAIVKDPYALVQALGSCKVTRIVLVPSLLRELLDTVPDLARRLPRLHFWVASGEVLPVDLADRFLLCMPNSRLINLYGSSEVSADVTWHAVTAAVDLPSVPIGRPIANTEIHIVGSALPARADRRAGRDLCRRSRAGAWLSPPSRSHRRLVAGPTPFATRSMRASIGPVDIGRYRADGTIEYLGRADQQVKLRGMRIELGEIETVLRQYPAVEDAMVLLEEDTTENARLAGFVVLRPGSRAGGSELKRHLRESLPAYMVPATVTALDKLVRTPSGKLDRRAIRPDRPAEPMRGTRYLCRHAHRGNATSGDLAERAPAGCGRWRRRFLRARRPLAPGDAGSVPHPGHISCPRPLTYPIYKPHDRNALRAAACAGRGGGFPGCREGVGAAGHTSGCGPHRHCTGAAPQGARDRYRRPFFFLYPEVTTAFYGLDLARHLGEDQPFYIIHPHGFDGGPIPLTIEEMAAETLQLVRAAQPQGPSSRARCAAGTETFELARQLRAEGQAVNAADSDRRGDPSLQEQLAPQGAQCG